MKNILKKIGFASVVVLSGAAAAVAAPALVRCMACLKFCVHWHSLVPHLL